MADSHNDRIDDLVDGRLSAALAHKDKKAVRDVLSEIGKAELDNGPKKRRIRPSPVALDKPL